MIEIVRKLPKHVRLSQHLRERAPFFMRITSFGIPYYIAATPKVRRLLELDEKGREGRPDRRRSWSNFDKADALRDIVGSLELQVRDVVLAGIEENVTDTLLNEMRTAMQAKVHATIEDQAAPRLLPAASAT